jgi:hypothetical protein
VPRDLDRYRDARKTQIVTVAETTFKPVLQVQTTAGRKTRTYLNYQLAVTNDANSFEYCRRSLLDLWLSDQFPN